MIYIFNELSSKWHVSSIQAAKEVFCEFVLSCSAAQSIGLKNLRFCEDSYASLYELEIYPNYNVGRWMEDASVNRDIRERFRIIITSSPLIKLEETLQHTLFKSSEFSVSFDGKTLTNVPGLGAAYVFDTLAISLDTHSFWRSQNFLIQHYFLDEQGEATCSERSVRNFFSADSLGLYSEWISEQREVIFRSGREFWDSRESALSRVLLCSEVEGQLSEIGSSKIIKQIVDRLMELDRYVNEYWLDGGFSYVEANALTNLQISPESDTTLRRFGASRKFAVPGRGKEVFSLHIKTGMFRFHFFPDDMERKIYIGYIGKHLKTATG